MRIFDFNNLPMLNIAWRITGGEVTKPSVWLISIEDKEPIGVIVRDNVLYCSLPMTLAEGTYGLKAAWLKDGKREAAEVQDLFKVTTDQDEAEEGDFDTITLECESNLQPATANDGLSAYELSVLKGRTTYSESDWLDEINGVKEDTHRGIAEQSRVEGEMKRVEQEVLRQKEWEYRKPLIDGAVASVNGMMKKFDAIELDIDGKMRKLENLILMYQNTVANVGEVVNRANGAAAVAGGVTGSLERRMEELEKATTQRVDMMFEGLRRELMPRIAEATQAWINQETDRINERHKSLKQIEQKMSKSVESLRPFIERLVKDMGKDECKEVERQMESIKKLQDEVRASLGANRQTIQTEVKLRADMMRGVIIDDVRKQVAAWIMERFAN